MNIMFDIDNITSMHPIAEEYKKHQSLYNDFRTKAEGLIKELLIASGLSYHKLESRIKDTNKLDEKILRKENKYDHLDDITDIVGIRIITFFEDDVDTIAKIILDEFATDDENSVDKRKLEVDRFGYKSLHYVVQFSDTRCGLTDYKRFVGKKFEIQIRSILQHAWAEIEHDLGYKSANEPPAELRRDFYRIAALLETADIEFMRLKKQLNDYEKNIVRTIEEAPEDVEINLASLRAYISNSPTVKKINLMFEESFPGMKIRIAQENSDYNSSVNKLYHFNVTTIKQLDNLIKENENGILAFAKKWLKYYPITEGRGDFGSDTSIFYLCYFLLGLKSDKEFISKYFEQYINYSIDNTLDEIVDRFMDIIKELKEGN